MAEPPPSSPGLGWQEDGGPRNRSPPVPHGVSMRAAPHWLPVYPLVRKNMDCIEAFSTSGVKVPRIMRCIQENLEAITMEPARQSLRSLLAVLSAQRPALVAVSLVKFSAPQDRYQP
ncbi:hypothetical protein AAES_153163 [Amazona aestiva]|uniref:Uncharacterized protein n=1 Tax=Amazona aestiva TaxID=12930 RepID=A0A0Q3P2I6_AMAAE|nr:hypothetical protein AAES_153163 [Amazona aestiva]